MYRRGYLCCGSHVCFFLSSSVSVYCGVCVAFHVLFLLFWQLFKDSRIRTLSCVTADLNYNTWTQLFVSTAIFSFSFCLSDFRNVWRQRGSNSCIMLSQDETWPRCLGVTLGCMSRSAAPDTDGKTSASFSDVVHVLQSQSKRGCGKCSHMYMYVCFWVEHSLWDLLCQVGVGPHAHLHSEVAAGPFTSYQLRPVSRHLCVLVL